MASRDKTSERPQRHEGTRSIGRFLSRGVALSLLDHGATAFLPRNKSALCELFGHMLRWFEVAASCHTCVPTK